MLDSAECPSMMALDSVAWVSRSRKSRFSNAPRSTSLTSRLSGVRCRLLRVLPDEK